MTKSRRYYEVFLSYAFADKPAAERVGGALAQAGLAVFDPQRARSSQDLEDTIRHALATSEALVAVVPRDGSVASNLAAELGAAIAWNKSVYLVQQEDEQLSLPAFLHGYQVYPISRLDDVVASIQRGKRPLPADQRATLREVYEQMRVPTDRFIDDPALLDQLAQRFAARTGANIAGEKLLAEMIRMRKQGKWPGVKRPS